MATGVTLAEMSRQTRAILGMSLNVAHGIDQEDSLREGLRRAQSDLWVMHDWPMLIVQPIVPVAAGEREIALPTSIDFEHIDAVYARTLDTDKWEKLAYGIGPVEMNVHDSDTGAQSTPLANWQTVAPDAVKIELWPVPSTSQYLKFVARTALLRLETDSDVCTLDSDLIISTYAAQALARQNSADAAIQLNKAQAILNRLRARQGANKREPFRIVTYLSEGVL